MWACHQAPYITGRYSRSYQWRVEYRYQLHNQLASVRFPKDEGIPRKWHFNHLGKWPLQDWCVRLRVVDIGHGFGGSLITLNSCMLPWGYVYLSVSDEWSQNTEWSWLFRHFIFWTSNGRLQALVFRTLRWCWTLPIFFAWSCFKKTFLLIFFFLQVGSFHLPHGDFFIEPVKNLSLAMGSSHPHVVYKKPRVPEAKESACGLMGTVTWSAPCFGLFSYHTTSAYSHLVSLFLLLKMMHPYQCCTSLSASEKRGKASPN